MSGVGGLGPTTPYRPLEKTDKDGGGGSGGRYMPGERRKREHHDDEAEISEEAKEKLARIKLQEAAKPAPDSAAARLHILNEIKHFNDLHQRSGSPLKAIIKPTLTGLNVLHVADPREKVDLKPFGEKDIFHYSAQEIRTRLEVLDHTSGANLDFRA